MPINGIMAFCTFYDDLSKLEYLDTDKFDMGKRGVSGLNKLVFKLKDEVAELDSSNNLVKSFAITLYPNSAFIMPLTTNRLYTHEITASSLNAELLPNRLGYVVRCSNKECIHKNGSTYVKKERDEIKLEDPTETELFELKHL